MPVYLRVISPTLLQSLCASSQEKAAFYHLTRGTLNTQTFTLIGESLSTLTSTESRVHLKELLHTVGTSPLIKN